MLKWLLASLTAALATSAAADTVTVPVSDAVATVQVISRLDSADGTPPPLILALHGYGMDERQIATLIPLLLTQPHVYASLRAPSVAPEGGRSWFEIVASEGSITIRPEDVANAATFVSVSAPLIAEHLDADPKRLHLIGYSQGGSLALSIAALAGQEFSSVAAFAGVLPDGLSVVRSAGPPVFAGHGTYDVLISPEEFDATVETLRGAGRPVTPIIEQVPHAVGNAGREALMNWLSEYL